MNLGPTLIIYVLLGAGVAVAMYATQGRRPGSERWFTVLTAVPFWPLYVPLLLVGKERASDQTLTSALPASDEMSAMIHQVDTELETALNSLDGWAEGVLAREKHRIHELRHAWTAQSDRIREMDRLLALPENAEVDHVETPFDLPATIAVSTTACDRLRHSQQVRRQNVARLRQVRRRAYEDLMGTLAWVRELVSMIHLAKFTGAPASRAEELVAQIAAAVEGLSELTWQDEPTAAAGDST